MPTASLKHLPPIWWFQRNLPPAPLAAEDASATPPALSQGELGTAYKLPDGYTMVWDRPQDLTANTGYAFRFRLVDAAGQPAGDVRPYLGMAGHAAFVKTDGTVFAHTHPEGSAAMQAMMLANGGSGEMADTGSMGGMDMASPAADPITHGRVPLRLSLAWTLSHFHPDEAWEHGRDGRLRR